MHFAKQRREDRSKDECAEDVSLFFGDETKEPFVEKREGFDEAPIADSPIHTVPNDLISTTPVMCSTEVFVCNIEYTTTLEQLESKFTRCGLVTSIRMPFDKLALRIKGFAFVAFESAESAQRAIKDLSGSYLNGRPLCVRPKTERRPMPLHSVRSPLASRRRGDFTFDTAATEFIPKTTSSRKKVAEDFTVFVGNIDFEAKRSEINRLFSEGTAATVKRVRIVTSDSGKSRGFGYVDFGSKEAAIRALALDGHMFYGRALRVNHAEGYKPETRKKKKPPVSDSRATSSRLPMARSTRYAPVFQVPRGYALLPLTAASAYPPMYAPTAYMTMSDASLCYDATRQAHPCGLLPAAHYSEIRGRRTVTETRTASVCGDSLAMESGSVIL